MPCNDTCRFPVFPCPAVVPFQQHPRPLVREAGGARSWSGRLEMMVVEGIPCFPERRIS